MLFFIRLSIVYYLLDNDNLYFILKEELFMFKNRITDEFMYPILGYDNYAISRSGFVGKSLRMPGNTEKYQDYKEVKPYMNGKSPWVKLYDKNGDYKRFSVARLNLVSIFGDLPFDIKYFDENPKHVSQDNLYYKFRGYMIEEDCEIDDIVYPGKTLLLIDNKKHCVAFRPFPDEYLVNNGRYWISSKGSVFDLHRQCLVSRSNDNNGYYKVTLQMPGYKEGFGYTYINPYRGTFKIHTLVYVAWKDTDLDGLTIDHVDGRRHNNDINNLEKVTIQENIRRAHDRNMYDDNIIRAKWSTGQVKMVCQMLQDGTLYKDIAEALGIDASDKTSRAYKSVANLCISIRDGRSFQNIARHYDIPNNTVTWETDYKTPTKFDPIIIRKICEGLVEGKGATELNRIYPEVPAPTIQNIKVGRQYKDIAAEVPGMDRVVNTRTRFTPAAREKGIETPERFNKDLYREWRNSERKRLRAAGIDREANMENTPWPEFLPEEFRH